MKTRYLLSYRAGDAAYDYDISRLRKTRGVKLLAVHDDIALLEADEGLVDSLQANFPRWEVVPDASVRTQ